MHHPDDLLTPAEEKLYARVSQIVYRAAGIVLGKEKNNLIKARLTRRISETGSASLESYVARIEGHGQNEELPHLVSALTTNYTHFFRENHHFDSLRNEALPEITARAPANIRIWSAGCSSGQEPLSIAITAAEYSVAYAARTKIVGTDIDRTILQKASTAEYQDLEINGIPKDLLKKHFSIQDGTYKPSPTIKEMIAYQELNLHGKWSFPFKFDVIFCRNVMIYFDVESQNKLWDKLIGQLADGGWLFIGHSERIPDSLREKVTPVGNTTYRKR